MTLQATVTPVDRGGAGGYHVRSGELCSDRKHTHSFLEPKHGYAFHLLLATANAKSNVVAKHDSSSSSFAGDRDTNGPRWRRRISRSLEGTVLRQKTHPQFLGIKARLYRTTAAFNVGAK